VDKLVAVLKNLADIAAEIQTGNCSDSAADKLADALHAVAAAIDDLTVELVKHRSLP
jgi:hypothetical protein